jgi:predicted cobalt transporter CbtA
VTLPRLLRDGLVAGAAAGLAAALVLWLVVEPVIRRALLVEEARPAHGHVHVHVHEELVSRGQQVVVGLVTTGVVGMLFGVVFAVVFARTRHRLPASSDQGRAVALAAVGCAVFVLLPALTVPANPPGVGDDATVTRRTLLYVLTILVGVVIAGSLFAVDGLLRARGRSDGVRRCLVALLGCATLVVFLVAIPDPAPVPSDVGADLIWDFRLASLAQLGVMWGTLGLVFGLLLERATVPSRPRVRA